MDREYTDAALRASGPAGQPMAAFASRLGQGGVDDLNQLLIPGGWVTVCHILRIAQLGCVGSDAFRPYPARSEGRRRISLSIVATHGAGLRLGVDEPFDCAKAGCVPPHGQ